MNIYKTSNIVLKEVRSVYSPEAKYVTKINYLRHSGNNAY
jgi:hypothetical protein